MILRKMDTPESRAYWEHIEQVAHEVRRDPYYHMVCPKPICHYGDGLQSCEEVIEKEKAPSRRC